MTELGIWWDRLATAFGHPAFHGVVLALLVGIALTEAAVQFFPAHWPALTAERIGRLIVFAVVITVGYWLHPTTIGAGWSLFAALSAPSVHHHMQSLAYHRWPALTPRALR